MSIFYFKFHCREWLTSETVMTCSLAAQGLFIRLLAISWLDDGLPADLTKLRRRAQVEPKTFITVFSELEDQFPIAEDGRRRNPFQEELRAKANAFSQAQAQRQLDRWAKYRKEPVRNPSTKLQKTHRLGSTEPIPCNYEYGINTLPLGNVKKKKPAAPEAFEKFWKAYPRRVGKGEALKSWTKKVETPELAAEILDVIAVRNTHPAGWPSEPKYIPHPATWLNQERWADDWQTDCQRPKPEPAKPAKPAPGRRQLDYGDFNPNEFNLEQEGTAAK